MKRMKASEWPERLKHLQQSYKHGKNHKTSPFILEGCDLKTAKFVGGYSEFKELVGTKYQV
ncbi:hypothetical protein ROZALSC1DRAFT_31689 [Rozella allomycis CSF55]|uniref:Glutaredoxin domain-containing protein n=1 Tax=Rozella allomycis (strain CSF55) TaxID=988480 RepID=A0A4P9YBK2_ROZAC|nr:hypothetical protein ROZALSC1DRAFT_31689 [Rozella allomycis CSF55]